MGRIARTDLLYNDCFAHVFSRSIARHFIFKGQNDFEEFRNLLKEAKQAGEFSIHHYCLMNTHFHMAVNIHNTERFSRALKELKRTYTYWFNKKYKRFGPLWRDRFKSMLIEDEEYLYACGQYIENNPVKAGMVKSSEEWLYSSSRFYQLGKVDDLVDCYQHGEMPMDVDINESPMFEKGSGIGSKLFKVLLRQEVGIG